MYRDFFALKDKFLFKKKDLNPHKIIILSSVNSGEESYKKNL